MLIPIIRGTTEIIEKVKNGEIIEKGCPKCQKDLVLKQYRTWGTLFLIPLAPRNETRFVYECIDCRDTFDPAYRKTFINCGQYLNATEEQVNELTKEFSLNILASILTIDNRAIENSIEIFKIFSVDAGINSENVEKKFDHSFLRQPNTPQMVFEWYDIFRDCFNEELRNKALLQVITAIKSIELKEKEKILLYTYWRHWGFTKPQFEEFLNNQQ